MTCDPSYRATPRAAGHCYLFTPLARAEGIYDALAEGQQSTARYACGSTNAQFGNISVGVFRYSMQRSKGY